MQRTYVGGEAEGCSPIKSVGIAVGAGGEPGHEGEVGEEEEPTEEGGTRKHKVGDEYGGEE